jgi:hypothetical protein
LIEIEVLIPHSAQPLGSRFVESSPVPKSSLGLHAEAARGESDDEIVNRIVRLQCNRLD